MKGTRLKLAFAKPYRHWVNGCLLAVAACGLTACVTINIYFPAAAAEKAADKVIDEIWQTPAGQAPSHNPDKAPNPTPKESNVPAATPAVTLSVNQESAP